MPRYATDTVVPIERSRAEIEMLLVRYGASQFHSGWMDGRALIAFKLKELFIRFILPIPDRAERRFWWKAIRGHTKKLTESQAERNWEQECRSRWRALVLVVKAKLEAVECGISTLENEFMAFIVLANNETLGQWVINTALPAIREGQMPKMLTGGESKENIPDAEVT